MATVLALDVGGTKLAAAVVDDAGRILGRGRVPSPTGTDPEQLYEALLACAAAALRGADVLPGDLSGIGVAAAGPMVWPSGEVSPLNMPAWRGFPLRKRLAEEFASDRVLIHNDAVGPDRGRALEGRRVRHRQPARHDRVHRGRRRPHPRRPPLPRRQRQRRPRRPRRGRARRARPAPAAGAAAWRRSRRAQHRSVVPWTRAGGPDPGWSPTGSPWPRRPPPGTRSPCATWPGPAGPSGRRSPPAPACSTSRWPPSSAASPSPARPSGSRSRQAFATHAGLPVRGRLPGRPRPAGRSGRPARRGRLRARPRSLRLGPRPGARVTRMGFWLRTESGG
jgi:hypothetical protein